MLTSWLAIPAVSQARWQAALDGSEDLLVVEARGEGMVGFGHLSGDLMSGLYLLAGHRRRGIGRSLVRELCALARGRGVEELRFHVLAMNSAAIAFYETMGGRPVDRISKSEDGRSWEDLVFELPTADCSDRP
ncbi:MAG TPA: GNAT family N-acetyltransferase [Caulobacteraceae bacterium]|nr:GNAT family N-acetyltransferase [Caulobacteraceae bacterium]